MLRWSTLARDVQSWERRVTFVFMLAAIVVITVIALLAVGKLGELPDTTSDRAPLALPDDRVLTNTDVDSLRFNVGARGYRMDEVDVVLDRLSAEVSQRDARIAALEAALTATAVPSVDVDSVVVVHHEEADPTSWA
jgi:DivIVA domain-containing protein